METLVWASLIAATLSGATPQVQIVDEIGSLRGLDGVEIVIERTTTEAAWEGLTVDSLRAEITRRLGDAGIAVLPESGEPQPWLYVSVAARQGREALERAYALSVSLELRQAVRLHRDQNMLGIATTWQTSRRLRVVSRDELSDAGDVLSAALAEFIEAYRTENSVR